MQVRERAESVLLHEKEVQQLAVVRNQRNPRSLRRHSRVDRESQDARVRLGATGPGRAAATGTRIVAHRHARNGGTKHRGGVRAVLYHPPDAPAREDDDDDRRAAPPHATRPPPARAPTIPQVPPPARMTTTPAAPPHRTRRARRRTSSPGASPGNSVASPAAAPMIVSIPATRNTPTPASGTAIVRFIVSTPCATAVYGTVAVPLPPAPSTCTITA